MQGVESSKTSTSFDIADSGVCQVGGAASRGLDFEPGKLWRSNV
jgi:hypothetical protein